MEQAWETCDSRVCLKTQRRKSIRCYLFRFEDVCYFWHFFPLWTENSCIFRLFCQIYHSKGSICFCLFQRLCECSKNLRNLSKLIFCRCYLESFSCTESSGTTKTHPCFQSKQKPTKLWELQNPQLLLIASLSQQHYKPLPQSQLNIKSHKANTHRTPAERF